MDVSPISSRLRSAQRRNRVGADTKDWVSLMLITPIWQTIQQYLSHKDIVNLSNVNRDLRLNYYFLCTHLYIDNPHYTYVDKWAVVNFESAEFIIEKFPNLLSLKISQRVQNFNFLRHINLKHLKLIEIDLLFYLDDFFYCIPEFLSELVIKIYDIQVDSDIVFNNFGRLKELKKLSIVGEYKDKYIHISLINLPKSLQYVSIDGISYVDNVNMTHLVNLRGLRCQCLDISTHNLHCILPSNLGKLDLTVYLSDIEYFDISFLTNLKILLLNVSDPINNGLPVSLQKLVIYDCPGIKALKIPHLINLKIIHCGLTIIRDTDFPCNLEDVTLYNCHNIENLRMSHLIHLKKLSLNNLDNLKLLTLPVALKDTISLKIANCNINNIIKYI